jgi:hypothetical protein
VASAGSDDEAWENEQRERAQRVVDEMFNSVSEESANDDVLNALLKWASLTEMIRTQLDANSIWYFVNAVEQRTLAERGSRGAAKRHEADLKAKRAVFHWCDLNRQAFTKQTLDAVAWQIHAEQVVPNAVSTIRRWLTEYRSSRLQAEASRKK